MQAGKLPTGILTPTVKNSGFKSVSDFLDNVGTEEMAKVLQQTVTSPHPPPPTSTKRATSGHGRENEPGM